MSTRPLTAAESIAVVSPFEAAANQEAARIAAHEVEGRALHCPVHRESLNAWKRGERSWPWPDPMLARRPS